MVLNIRDRELNLLGQLDKFESFVASKKYIGIGSFELHIALSSPNVDKLVEENIIHTSDSKAYIILYSKKDSTKKSLVVKGLEIKSLLKRMIVFPPDSQAYYRINSNAETIMKSYVSSQLIRKNITSIEVAPSLNRGDSLVYQSRYKNLAEELETIGLASGLGWDINLDLQNKKYIFDIIEGRDLTSGQNLLPPAIFSIDYDNIESQTFEESKLDYANVAIVGGKGTGADREIDIVGSTDGLDAYELFVDARDLEDVGDLADRGQQKLKEVEKRIVFDSRVLANKNLIYEEDYKLGDIVTITNSDWQVTVNRQITEITEIYESAGFKLDIVFGEDILTVADKIKQMLTSTIDDGSSSDGGNIDGGKPNTTYGGMDTIVGGGV